MSVLSTLRAMGNRFPLVTNMVLVGSLYTAGDISQQTIRNVPEYNWENTSHIAAISCLLFGPFYHVWYPMLDKKFPGNAIRVVSKKLLLDQLLLSPALLTVFFGGMRVLEGRSDLAKKDVIEQAPKAFLTGCFFWPPVQFLNFRFLPTAYRTAYVSGAAFVWTNILCYFKSQALDTEIATEKKQTSSELTVEHKKIG